jgi:hypothetical protein
VYLLDDIPGAEVNDADAAVHVLAGVNEASCEEGAGVACRVILDEERVGSERAPEGLDRPPMIASTTELDGLESPLAFSRTSIIRGSIVVL